MFSAQPQPTTRSASRISSAASGEANPPEMPSDQGVAGEQAVRDGRGREQRPGRRRRAPAAPAGAARAAAGDEHRALRGREQPRPARSTAPRPAGPGRARAPRAAARPGAGAACTSSGQVEHDRAPLLDGRPVGPDDVGGAPTRACAPARRTAPTAVTSASWSMRKFERTAAAPVSAASTSSGVRLFAASVMPVIALVSPQPWCTVSTAGPPGRARPGVGHRRGAALVPGRDERDAGGAQRVRHVEVAAADDAERVPDASRAARDESAARASLDRRRPATAVVIVSTSASTRAGLPDPDDDRQRPGDHDRAGRRAAGRGSAAG